MGPYLLRALRIAGILCLRSILTPPGPANASMKVRCNLQRFGTSAFLKLLCLNERSQRLEIRSRLAPSGDAYDFHRSLRLKAKRLLVRGEPLDDLIVEASTIKNSSERASAISGLHALQLWRAANPGPVLDIPPAAYESPSGIFAAKFTPDFGLDIRGDSMAIHLWNTKSVKLAPRMVYAALSLFESAYAEVDSPPDDLAVLSLPDERLYRLSDAGARPAIGPAVAKRIEDLFRDEREGLGFPPLSPRPGTIS
jgi:hypothetical protein